uniref:Uncharacterized protein n=1 Tax=Piliocolobus tephrosceles TaxID=591936 RepID=A0A8C9GNL9_9PRIM
MEILDEFDSEFPQSETFCQQISEEDLDRQADTTLERALRRLFHRLDRNPSLAERVVQLEQRGLLSLLRVRVVQGELNHCNSTGVLEIHERVEQLKQSIHRVHLYSRDTKKGRRKPRQKKPEPILLRDQSTSPCLPPTLLPPLPLPPPWSPWVFGPFPSLPCKSVSGSLPHSRQSWVPPAQNNPRGSPGPVAVALSPLLFSSRPLFADRVLMDKADKRCLLWLRHWVRLKAPRGSTFLTLGKQGSPRCTRQDPGAPKGQVENQRDPPTSPAPVLPLPVGMSPHAILCLQCTGLEPGWCLAPGRCRGMLTRGSQGSGAWACCFQPHMRNGSLQG